LIGSDVCKILSAINAKQASENPAVVANFGTEARRKLIYREGDHEPKLMFLTCGPTKRNTIDAARGAGTVGKETREVSHMFSNLSSSCGMRVITDTSFSSST
jgi:hypothetical protein